MMVFLTLQTELINSFSYHYLKELNTTYSVYLWEHTKQKSLNATKKRNIKKEGYNIEEHYPFTTKPLVSRWGRILESEFAKRFQIFFLQDDNIGDHSGFKPKVIDDESNLSVYLVDTLFFVNVFSKQITPRVRFLKENE